MLLTTPSFLFKQIQTKNSVRKDTPPAPIHRGGGELIIVHFQDSRDNACIVSTHIKLFNQEVWENF